MWNNNNVIITKYKLQHNYQAHNSLSGYNSSSVLDYWCVLAQIERERVDIRRCKKVNKDVTKSPINAEIGTKEIDWGIGEREEKC